MDLHRPLLASICLPAAIMAADILNEPFSAAAGGWIDGWTRGDPAKVSLVAEAGNPHLRIVESGAAAVIKRELAVDGAAGALDLRIRVRSTGLKRGEKPWMTGRMEYQFLDAAGNRTGSQRWLGLEADGSTQGWQQLTRRENIPAGATRLALALGIWAASGTVDFDDLAITPVTR